MEEIVKTITQTVEGYPIKNIKWNERDNLIVGQVKCPIIGNPKLHDGYVTVQWNKRGKPINFNKGREDFILNLF